MDRAHEPAAAMPEPRAVAAPIPKIVRSIEKRFFAPWFWGGEFSGDWVSGHIPVWRRVLGGWRDRPLRIIEIGSWEGRSALFFLKFFPRSRVTCIDTFAGGKAELDHVQWGAEVPRIERRFDRNLARYAARVEKIKARSAPALEALAAAARRYDLAYVDGSHRRADVMEDSLRVWPLVVPGGVVIWDDYDWGRDLPADDRPQPAIDQFLAGHANEFRVLSCASQMIVERLR